MAGMPYGMPAGTIGPRSMDLTPYLQSWQLRQRGQEAEAQRAQQDAQFAREMEFRQTAQDTSNKLSELQLKRQQGLDEYGKQQDAQDAMRYDQARQDKLNEIKLREEKYNTARSDRDRMQLKSESNLEYAVTARADMEKFAGENAGLSPEEIHSRAVQNVATLPLTPEQKATALQAADDWYKRQAPIAAKKKADEGQKAITSAELETRSELDRIASRDFPNGATSQEDINTVVRFARTQAQDKYKDSPERLKAAMNAIDSWEAGQYARGDIKAKREQDAAKVASLDRSRIMADYSRIQDDLINIEEAIDATFDEAVKKRLEAQRDALEAKLSDLDAQMGYSAPQS